MKQKTKKSKYDTKSIYDMSVKAIAKDRHIVFLQDVYMTLGISAATYYRYIKVGSKEYNDIQELLEDNRTAIKVLIRKKMLESGNATQIIALYRLLATQEEQDALNAYRNDENKNKQDTKIDIILK